MPILLDSHVHLYKNYDLKLALSSAAENLMRISKESSLPSSTVNALLLTERYDCDAYNTLLSKSAKTIQSLSLTELEGGDAIGFSDASNGSLFILPGRQIVTKENIEVHALLTREKFPDRVPLREIIPTIQSAGAVVAMPWAPGKWLGKRGQAIKELLLNSGDPILLSDTALRPSLTPIPSMYSLFNSRGLPALCGTDPLPLQGEEVRIGKFASYYSQEVDSASPSTSIRKALLTKGATLSLGARLNVIQVGQRLIRLKLKPS